MTFGPVDAPIASWAAAEPLLTLPAETLADLAATLPTGAFHVRQQGSYALSEPLRLHALS